MRFVILNLDYPAFLEALYAAHPGLESASWAEQLAARNRSLFGSADSYSHHLRALGHEAVDVHANNQRLQDAWLREHGARPPGGDAGGGGAPPGTKRRGSRTYEALAAQIEHYRPDVLLNFEVNSLRAGFLREMRPHLGLVVGQIATAFPPDLDVAGYDLVLSSLPPIVSWFRERGVRAERFRLGFEPRVLERLNGAGRDIPVSFVGSLFPGQWAGRMAWIARLVELLPELEIWGPHDPDLPAAVRARHKGEAWGEAMYRILARSRVTLNQHGEIAGAHANNMRLYEATGVGTLLVTDWKRDLADVLEPGREVATWTTAEECAERVRWHLEHEGEREAVARAGQARTLAEHSYAARMRELVALLERVLG